jgi:pyridoxamine 5'-phosphate oxidase
MSAEIREEQTGLQMEQATDPLALFGEWMAEAKASEPNDPNAMSLATSTPDGHPSVRIVLLKRFNADGFAFYTNGESRKGCELRANPRAALCLHWKSLRRQVRLEGPLVELAPEDVDEYFHSRHRMSQIGAWASQQSRPLDSREDLIKRTHEIEFQFPGEIPRPTYWTGFSLQPSRIEFWHERDFRLHDRFVFEQNGTLWTKQRLYP